MTTTTTRIERTWVEFAREPRTCDQHGDYECVREQLVPAPVHLQTGRPVPVYAASTCPQCDRKKQREADVREAEIRGGMTERDRLRAAALREAGIPERFKDADVWHWQHGMDQQRRVWDVVRSYCTGFESVLQTGACLTMLGAPGTGKTHLAIGIVRHVIEKGGTALYTTAMDAVGRIRATFDKSTRSETEQAALESMASVDLLAVDEVGRQTDSAHERETLFRILDARYRGLRPTVLVSNLNPTKLAAFLGEAVVDRLKEAGGRWLVFDWASHRSRRAANAPSGEGEE